MKKGYKPLAKIPTTRNWYKEFREIMNDKCQRLEDITQCHWVWGYSERDKLPFSLICSEIGFDALFETDGEIYEAISGMIWGIEWGD